MVPVVTALHCILILPVALVGIFLYTFEYGIKDCLINLELNPTKATD